MSYCNKHNYVYGGRDSCPCCTDEKAPFGMCAKHHVPVPVGGMCAQCAVESGCDVEVSPGRVIGAVENTLTERGRRYGSFDEHARIAQTLKEVMQGWYMAGDASLFKATKWSQLADYQKEALEMIAHKIGRILNGDPTYADSWHDIAGYAKLVEDHLNGVT